MNDDWLSLPSLRDRYQRLLGQIDLLQAVERIPSATQKQLQGEAWVVRRDAYKILAKAFTERPEALVEKESLPFGWSLEQLGDNILREWLAQ